MLAACPTIRTSKTRAFNAKMQRHKEKKKYCINHGKGEQKLYRRVRRVRGENPLKLCALRALCGEKVFTLCMTITEKKKILCGFVPLRFSFLFQIVQVRVSQGN